MALSAAQVRQVAADWSEIVFQRSGATVVYALDDIMNGVSQVDAGMVISGSTISSSFSISGPMAAMTTRQTSIMVGLVMQTRTGI